MQPLGRNRARIGRSDSPVDAEIVRLAAQGRHGVLAADELCELGLSSKAIRSRVAAGWLVELFPGAYAVGLANLTRRSYWRAAVLSCGRGAFLSHRAAAELWRLIDLIPGPPHVTIPHGRRLHRPGIVVHRARSLGAGEVTTHLGIPVTTPSRTLIDFSAHAAPYELRNAVRAAKKHDRLDVPLIDRLCSDHRGLRGTARLRSLIAEDPGPVQDSRSPR